MKVDRSTSPRRKDLSLYPKDIVADIQHEGIYGFGDIKWMLTACLYLASFFLFMRDQWYGTDYFEWHQGAIVLVLSFCTIASISWESLLLGPVRGVNLILHLLLMAPFSLFLGGIIGRPTPRDGGGWVSETISFLTKSTGIAKIYDLIPGWLQDLFSQPSLLIIIALLALALNCRSIKAKIGLLATLFIVPLASIFYPDSQHSAGWFLSGTVAMCIGIAMQFFRYDKAYNEEKILSRLARQNISDEKEWETTLRIMKSAHDNGFITMDNILSISRRIYPESGKNATIVLCKTLVDEHRLLETRGSIRDMYFIPSQPIGEDENLLADIAVWPRRLVLSAIAVLWVLSPIDAVPDAIPLLGALDDATILLLAAGQWKTGDSPSITRGRIESNEK